MPLKNARAVTYARELGTSTDARYEDKFDALVRLCEGAPAAGADAVVVAAPEALGDTYGEVMESLRRIARAELAIIIVPEDRGRSA